MDGGLVRQEWNAGGSWGSVGGNPYECHTSRQYSGLPLPVALQDEEDNQSEQEGSLVSSSQGHQGHVHRPVLLVTLLWLHEQSNMTRARCPGERWVSSAELGGEFAHCDPEGKPPGCGGWGRGCPPRLPWLSLTRPSFSSPCEKIRGH